MERAEKIIRSIAKNGESEETIKIMAIELDSTIRGLAENVFDIIVDIPMAEPCATFYLWKLLNMIPQETAEKLLENLPDMAKAALDEAIARHNAKH